jgi:hypothetical protein
MMGQREVTTSPVFLSCRLCTLVMCSDAANACFGLQCVELKSAGRSSMDDPRSTAFCQLTCLQFGMSESNCEADDAGAPSRPFNQLVG